MVSLSFGYGGSQGVTFQNLTVGSMPTLPQVASDEAVDNGKIPAWATIGTTAVGAMGAHLLANTIRGKGKPRYSLKDATLDALSGAAIGSCFAPGRFAEAVCIGALSAVPVAIVARSKDSTWDFRYNLATQGALRLGIDLLGGVPVPYQGWRWANTERTAARMHIGELLANSGVDVIADALTLSFGHTLAASLQGKRGKPLLSAGWDGARMGLLQGSVVTLIAGAPFRPDPDVVQRGIDMVADVGGADLSDVRAHTTFRTGGFSMVRARGIALPGSVTIAEDRLANPGQYGHELTHRDQFVGGAGRSGRGAVRPGGGLLGGYAQYAWHRGSYEREAYVPSERQRMLSDESRPVTPLEYEHAHEPQQHWGSFLSYGLSLAGFGLLAPSAR